MKTRLISAGIAIPIFSWIILFSPDFIFLGFWFITLALAGYEFSKLIPFAKKNNFYIFNLINCLFLILGLVNFLNLSHYLFSLAFFLWLILVPILLFRYSKFQSINKLEYQIIVFFWLVLSWAIANTLSSFILGKGAILGLLSCIWAADGGAYFTGKFLGKNKFSPKISPNKTWEGFWGGCLASLISSFIVFFLFLGYALKPTMICILAMIPTIIYAAFGDLFESMLKRAAKVKDSGNIIPGHGGVFDRIDSWLAALIIFPTFYYLLVKLFFK